MSILKSVSSDIHDLVLCGYTDKEIAKSTGFELSIIQHIIDYWRKTIKNDLYDRHFY